MLKTALTEPFSSVPPPSRFPYEVAMVMIIILDRQDTVIIAIKKSRKACHYMCETGIVSSIMRPSLPSPTF